MHNLIFNISQIVLDISGLIKIGLTAVGVSAGWVAILIAYKKAQNKKLNNIINKKLDITEFEKHEIESDNKFKQINVMSEENKALIENITKSSESLHNTLESHKNSFDDKLNNNRLELKSDLKSSVKFISDQIQNLNNIVIEAISK